MIGASASRGGKAFICMSSVYVDKDGQTHSRVRPQFNGDIITSPRSQVYFLATEYGVVNLEAFDLGTCGSIGEYCSSGIPRLFNKRSGEKKIWRRSNRIR